MLSNKIAIMNVHLKLKTIAYNEKYDKFIKFKGYVGAEFTTVYKFDDLAIHVIDPLYDSNEEYFVVFLYNEEKVQGCVMVNYEESKDYKRTEKSYIDVLETIDEMLNKIIKEN